VLPDREATASLRRRLPRISPEGVYFFLVLVLCLLTIPLYRIAHPEVVAYHDARTDMAASHSHRVAGRVNLLAEQLTGHPEFLATLSVDLAKNGQPVAAKYLFAKALESGFRTAGTAQELAGLLWTSGQTSEALAVLDEATAAGIAPDDTTRRMKAGLLLARGRP